MSKAAHISRHPADMLSTPFRKHYHLIRAIHLGTGASAGTWKARLPSDPPLPPNWLGRDIWLHDDLMTIAWGTLSLYTVDNHHITLRLDGGTWFTGCVDLSTLPPSVDELATPISGSTYLLIPREIEASIRKETTWAQWWIAKIFGYIRPSEPPMGETPWAPAF
ncbi:hypothetical protein PUNSTDRAFT_132442 [Punctularia strigosozonata HHB-11173 SS5]|uniref:uncharacterized protein n=1 Tax=Punctularia strigosozonata (strain HHB-11173) TaxID=741275 RepID=UPI00044171BB|nr:uncharacterized protein PUNSTDRAFT_132442 [Punctularia strigosozonata HHB-11173 SS5]EIN10349.1 hypothetical protein PUNSTDRAFT_132442 [Punctularia strigosozonata HHB-11173 SS5]